MSVNVVTRISFSMVLLAMLGCQATEGNTTLSHRYGICANLPVGVEFRKVAPGPDFDLGVLESEGHYAEVFIGRHPKFSHRVIKRGVTATDGFELLGQESGDGVERMLYAYNRGDLEGPSYVMFMAVDIRPMKKILNAKNFLVSCR